MSIRLLKVSSQPKRHGEDEMVNRDAFYRTTEVPQPCDYCGELTNTPGACFDCAYQPYGVAWELEMEERYAS
jgi:hypothetical protein